jgi:hypothetical protein
MPNPARFNPKKKKLQRPLLPLRIDDFVDPTSAMADSGKVVNVVA